VECCHVTKTAHHTHTHTHTQIPFTKQPESQLRTREIPRNLTKSLVVKHDLRVNKYGGRWQEEGNNSVWTAFYRKFASLSS